jgi:hypothetical protein
VYVSVLLICKQLVNLKYVRNKLWHAPISIPIWHSSASNKYAHHSFPFYNVYRKLVPILQKYNWDDHVIFFPPLINIIKKSKVQHINDVFINHFSINFDSFLEYSNMNINKLKANPFVCINTTYGLFNVFLLNQIAHFMQHCFIDFGSHAHSLIQLILIIVAMLIHSLHIDTFIKRFWSSFWKPMVLFVWTKFDTRLMNCLDSSFVIGSCNLVSVASCILRRSFDEFDIFLTPLDVCYKIYIFSYFATSFGFILF